MISVFKIFVRISFLIFGLSICFQSQGAKNRKPSPIGPMRVFGEKLSFPKWRSKDVKEKQRTEQDPATQQREQDFSAALRAGEKPANPPSSVNVPQRLNSREAEMVKRTIEILGSKVPLSEKTKSSIQSVMESSHSLRRVLKKWGDDLLHFSLDGSPVTEADVLTISWRIADLKGLSLKIRYSDKATAQKVKMQLEEEVRIIQKWITEIHTVNSREALSFVEELDFLYRAYQRRREWGTAEKLNSNEIESILRGLKAGSGQEFRGEERRNVLYVLEHRIYGSLVGRDLQNLLSALSVNPSLVSPESMQALVWQILKLKDFFFNSNQPFSYEANRMLINEMLKLHQVVIEVLTKDSRERLNALNQSYTRSQRSSTSTRTPNTDEMTTAEVNKSPEVKSTSPEALRPLERQEVYFMRVLSEEIPILKGSSIAKQAVQEFLVSHPEVNRDFENLIVAFKDNRDFMNPTAAKALVGYIQHVPKSHPGKIREVRHIIEVAIQDKAHNAELAGLLFEFYGRGIKSLSEERYRKLWQIIHGKPRIRKNFTDEEKRLFQELGDYPSVAQLKELFSRIKLDYNEAKIIAQTLLRKARIPPGDMYDELLHIIESVPHKEAQYLQKTADTVRKDPSIITVKGMKAVIWNIINNIWEKEVNPFSELFTFFIAPSSGDDAASIRKIQKKVPLQPPGNTYFHSSIDVSKIRSAVARISYYFFRFSYFNFNKKEVDFLGFSPALYNRNQNSWFSGLVTFSYERNPLESEGRVGGGFEQHPPSVSRLNYFRSRAEKTYQNAQDIVNQILNILDRVSDSPDMDSMLLKLSHNREMMYEKWEYDLIRAIAYDRRIANFFREFIDHENFVGGRISKDTKYTFLIITVTLINLGYVLNTRQNHPSAFVREAKQGLRYVAEHSIIITEVMSSLPP